MAREKPTPEEGPAEWGVNHDLDKREEAREIGDITGKNQAGQQGATW